MAETVSEALEQADEHAARINAVHEHHVVVLEGPEPEETEGE